MFGRKNFPPRETFRSRHTTYPNMETTSLPAHPRSSTARPIRRSIIAAAITILLVATSCGMEVETVAPVTEPGIRLEDPTEPAREPTDVPATSGDEDQRREPEPIASPTPSGESEPPADDGDDEAEASAGGEPDQPTPGPVVPASTLDEIYDVTELDLRGLADGTTVVAPECADIDNATVTQIPDILIDPVVINDRYFDSQDVEGETIPAYEVAEVVIPGAVVDTGCIIEYDAPGGCFGAVEITGVRIPPSGIPGEAIPDVDISATRIPGQSAAAIEIPGEVQEGVFQEAVCQVELQPGDAQPSVTRPSLTRPSLTRGSATRRSLTRPSDIVDGTYIDSVYVDSVYMDSVYVDSVYIDSKYLDSRPPIAEAVVPFEGPDETAYFLEADVLFDFDESVLRPGADTTLAAVAEELISTGASEIEVGGHTDSIGGDAYNQELSEARAATVTDWLVTNGGIERSSISSVGYGESAPVAPNTNEDGSDNPQGRQRNRRVVITAG